MHFEIASSFETCIAWVQSPSWEARHWTYLPAGQTSCIWQVRCRLAARGDFIWLAGTHIPHSCRTTHSLGFILGENNSFSGRTHQLFLLCHIRVPNVSFVQQLGEIDLLF